MIKGFIFSDFLTDSIRIHPPFFAILFLDFLFPSTWKVNRRKRRFEGFWQNHLHRPNHPSPLPKNGPYFLVGGNSLFPKPTTWSSDASGHHQGYAYTMQNSADPWAYERRQYWVPDVPMKSRTSFEGSFDQPKNTGLVGFRRFRVTNFLIFCRVRKGSWIIAWRIETMKWNFRRNWIWVRFVEKVLVGNWTNLDEKTAGFLRSLWMNFVDFHEVGPYT